MRDDRAGMGGTRGSDPSDRPFDSVIDGGAAIVVGAGLAGLFTALTIARGLGAVPGSERTVTLVALDAPGRHASSGWAQGGIAAAMGAGDSPDAHAADTMAVGGGIVDPAVAAMVAHGVPARVEDLLALGVPFDRDETGALTLGREAAHSANRIVKVSGDKAGAVITATLGQRVFETDTIRMLTGVEVQDLAVENGRITGVFAAAGPDRRMVMIRAPHVVLATGGAGALYKVATAPLAMVGTGLGLAARAGAQVADAEFVQFHPTGMALGVDPAPLATEALRGEGAILTTQSGERFMTALHPDGELAPRDVVARAIHARLAAGDTVYLDCRKALGASFADRFPTVYGFCRAAGLDPARDPIPIAPAAHYHMGGVAVDREGRSTVPGLWACGEVSSTGLHGANRLASNSLAEALVFAGQIGMAVRDSTPEPVTGADRLPALVFDTPVGRHASPVLARLRGIMTREVGLIRDRSSLVRAARDLHRMARQLRTTLVGPAAYGNVLAAATLIIASAAERTESRGSHYRTDYPEPDPAWARRSATTLAAAESCLLDLAEEAAPGYDDPVWSART
ncbi:MAG: L-aspartate oxidase [Alphaproteobacteria bacterium]